MLKRCMEPKNQKKIEKKSNYMDDKDKNGDGGSGRYHRKNWGDKKNQKDPKAGKVGGIPSGVDFNMLTYNNRSWK